MHETPFQLDSAIVPAGHGEAAAWWGVSRKTLGRWKDAGVAAQDPCPYRSDPQQMADWYARVFARPVPESIHATIARIRGPAVAVPSAVPASAAADTHRAIEGIVLEASRIQRLRELEMSLCDRYQRALKDTSVDERTLTKYRDEWQETAGEVSLHEQRAKKTGELLPPQEYEHGFRRMMAALPQALVSVLGERLTLDEKRELVREAFRRLPDTLEGMLAA